MFEGNGSDTDNLADTDTEVYILGIKYRTPNGKWSEEKMSIDSLLLIDSYVILDDIISRLWFTYRSGFAPIGQWRDIFDHFEYCSFR